MTLIETDMIYFNTQVYFRKHYIDDLPNDDNIWKEAYKKWLLSQGCVIVPYTKDEYVLKTSLGIAPYLDKFGFDDPNDAMLFVLRWS